MGRQLGLSDVVSIGGSLGGKEIRFWIWIVNTDEWLSIVFWAMWTSEGFLSALSGEDRRIGRVSVNAIDIFALYHNLSDRLDALQKLASHSGNT